MNQENYEACPVARSVELIGDRWVLLIIREAFDGVTRYSDFQKNLKVAKNILSDRLAKLVEAQILKNQPASDGSAYLEYVLTEQGLALFPIVVALRQWGEQFLFTEGQPHSLLVEKDTGEALAFMQPTTKKGKHILAQDTVVKKLNIKFNGDQKCFNSKKQNSAE